MDTLNLNSLKARLKSQGAQMGRILSSKVKDLLQSSTPESKMVTGATSEDLPEANWGMNMQICALINAEELSGTEVIRDIKKKLSSKSVAVKRLDLDLLETCAMNCDKVFSEIASEGVLEDMVKIVESPEADSGIRRRSWELIRAWGEMKDLTCLPVFRQTYMGLMSRRTSLPQEDGEPMSTAYPFESFFNYHPPSPPEEHHGAYSSSMAYNNGSLSAEQKKEIFAGTRSSLDLLTSILNTEPNQFSENNDLLSSTLERCRESLTVMQLIIVSTGDDEGMLFEALNLHDELQLALSKCEKLGKGAPVKTVSEEISGRESSSG